MASRNLTMQEKSAIKLMTAALELFPITLCIRTTSIGVEIVDAETGKVFAVVFGVVTDKTEEDYDGKGK